MLSSLQTIPTQVVPNYGLFGNSIGLTVSLLLGKLGADVTFLLIDCILRRSVVCVCWVLTWQASSIPHHAHELLLTN